MYHILHVPILPPTAAKREFLKNLADEVTLCKLILNLPRKRYFADLDGIYERRTHFTDNDELWILHRDDDAAAANAFPNVLRIGAIAYVTPYARDGVLVLESLCASDRSLRGDGKRLFEALCASAAAAGFHLLTLSVESNAVGLLYESQYGMTCPRMFGAIDTCLLNLKPPASSPQSLGGQRRRKRSTRRAKRKQ